MQTEAQKDNQSSQGASACPNCGAQMPRELRFCRACGFRLGEGVEEYNETRRFQGASDTARSAKSRTAEAAPQPTAPTSARGIGAMAGRIHEQTIKSVTTGLGKFKLGRACRRVPRWMVWVLIPLFIIGLTNGLFSPSSRTRNRNRGAATASAPSSFLGSHYKTVDGGALIEDVSPPGSAADKAGLIGGDLIKSFDGKPIASESDLTNVLTQTPVGKTVEVVYVRDGETKTVQLTTVSEEENDRLEQAFNDRPQPQGFLGVDDDMERVQIPGGNLYGVRLKEVYKNRPGYIAGLRAGDIVIEFDKIPIRTPQEFLRRIDRALPESIVKVVVMRGGERREIPVTMGED